MDAREAASTGTGERPVRRRRLAGVALIAAAAVGVSGAVVLLGSGDAGRRPGGLEPAIDPAGRPDPVDPAVLLGAPPDDQELVAFRSCDAALQALRDHAAASVTAWGLPGRGVVYGPTVGIGPGVVAGRTPVDAVPSSAAGNSAAGAAGSAVDAAAPDHSTTNDQEAGADEPDIVKTDGSRLVAVSGGILRVVGATTRKVTGTLDLRSYAGADGAELLLSGDRVLVLLGGPAAYPVYGPAMGSRAPTGASSTFLLVDVSAAPRIVSTLRVDGSYVDARLIAGRARVVVDSTPRLFLPTGVAGPDSARLGANQSAIRTAPLSAWRPTFQTTVAGVPGAQRSVPCERISHPARYRGDALVTVYTLDPASTLENPEPVSIAADGATVYASTTSLYVASSDGADTELHRFAVATPARPRYVGSGRVPGRLLNSYSMSEYAGTLRVVATGQSSDATSLYVLDAATLRRRGEVDGLGVGEQLHAVRFLGPLAYVVTFRSVDPLFVLDLRDPDHPHRAGELTLPGYSDYLHPTDEGRLLGVGQDVDAQQRVAGVQVSLFDVSRPGEPRRLAVLTRRAATSETPIDPHAFLYWPAARTAVVPLTSWTPGESGAVLVLHVGRDDLRAVGTLRNPGGGADGAGIVRTLVIGRDLWTMSGAGLQVSDLASLDRRGWIDFA
jgi:uncharacterized secreted protein with C-terminal beta-propeller domain